MSTNNPTPTPAADPAADVPQPQSDLTLYLVKQIARGVPHDDLIRALLANFSAMATVHSCCTKPAAHAALAVGEHLLATAIERPANAPIH